MKPTKEAIEAGVKLCWDYPRATPSIVRKILTAAYAAQFQSEEHADVIKSLRVMHDSIITDAKEQFRDGIHETMPSKAADALKVVLAERDALKSELIDYKDAAASEADFVNEQAEKIRELKAIRDALAARLAPVEDDALVEIVGRTLRAEVFDPDVLKVYGDLWAYDEQRKILKQARAAIAAIRPHIEAAERERCAKAGKAALLKSNYGELHADANYADELGEEIVAAIRSGK